jgi:hypothetical protein
LTNKLARDFLPYIFLSLLIAHEISISGHMFE